MTYKITLAIETTVGNGSLSLFENDELVDELSGEEKISRSDRFLPILDVFLKRNKIEKNNLDLIVVSLGEGSFTGTRIGLATAIAIKNGLGVKCLGVSVLRAIAYSSAQNNVITAILTDKNQVILEKFVSELSVNTDLPDLSERLISQGVRMRTIDDFVNELNSVELYTKILLERSLFEKLQENYGIENLENMANNFDIKDIGHNLSLFIGKAGMKNYGSDNLKALYVML